MAKDNNDVTITIDFAKIGLSPEKRIKLPGRRELSSRPWSEDQMNVFIERQKYVPRILAGMGIKILGAAFYGDLRKEWAANSRDAGTDTRSEENGPAD